MEATDQSDRHARAVAEGAGDRPAARDVVYLIATMKTGGAQTHLLQIFRFLDRSKYRPHLFCLRAGGDLIEAARGLDVPVTTLGMRGSLAYPGDLPKLWRLRARLRALRPAVIHGYLLRGNFFAATAGRMAGVPVIVTSKRDVWAATSGFERFAVRASNRLSTLVTGNSPAVIDFIATQPGGRDVATELIACGIDVDRFDPAAGDGLRASLGLGEAPVIATTSTFRPEKGFPLLCEALAKVKQSFPDVKLLFAGEAALRDGAAAVATELGVADSIVFLGKRDDMPTVLATADVFVLASQSEGMSNALLEAMAMGKPVVATDVGGNPEVVQGGEGGYLVPYPDADAMAARIGELLADSDLRRAVGDAARAVVLRRFTARSMAERTEELYDRLLAAASAG